MFYCFQFMLSFFFIISHIKKQHKLYLQTNPRLQIYQTNFITHDGHCDEAQGFLQIMNTDQKTVWNMGKSSSSDCILCLSISRSFFIFPFNVLHQIKCCFKWTKIRKTSSKLLSKKKERRNDSLLLRHLADTVMSTTIYTVTQFLSIWFYT